MKVRAYVKDKKAKQSTTIHNEGQASEKKMKGVPPNLIATSNSKQDTIRKIEGVMVNSNARAHQ